MAATSDQDIKSELRSETAETKVEDAVGSKLVLRSEATEIHIEDALLDISPGWRRMVDNSLPEIVAVLKSQTLRNASLFITVLLNDKLVIHYIQDLLNFPSTGKLSDVYRHYGHMFQDIERKYQRIDRWTFKECQNADTFYMAALNYEDQTVQYLDIMFGRSGVADLYSNLLMFGVLLAGAYYGGHDNLITIIKDRIQTLRGKDLILSMGLVGAMCAGRYHYITSDINIGIGDLKLMLEKAAPIVRDHFILSRDNVFIVMTRFPKSFRTYFGFKVIRRIMDRGSHGFIRWFLTSGLALDVRFDDIKSRPLWEIVFKNMHEVKLSDEIMTLIGSMPKLEFKMYVAIRTQHDDLFSYLIDVERYQDFVKMALWAIEFNNYSAFAEAVKRSSHYTDQRNVSSNQEVDIAIRAKINGSLGSSHQDFFRLIHGCTYMESVRNALQLEDDDDY